MNNNMFDLVMVGSGFASTFFLKKYLQKVPADTKVLVLERGYFTSHKDRLKARREETGEEKPDTKDKNENYKKTFINNTPDKHWIFTTGFGGSSNCWFACTPRFLPNDFKLKSLYGVGTDWPITYDQLSAYYDEVEEIMSVSGPQETPFPKERLYPQPPHTFTEVDKILKKNYGNLYINQPTARSRVPGSGRNACCANSVCSTCPSNAKFTIENSNMGVYEDERVEINYGAQVTELEFVNDTVRSVVFIKDGKEENVRSEVFALGANSIFNAHILLNSGDKNSLVGKGLGEQIGIQATVLLDNLQNVGGSTWVNANGYMLYDGEHRKDSAACLMESSNFPFVRMERGKWRNMASFRMIFEDLPEEKNSVQLTKDRLIPQVSHFGPSSYTLRGIERMKQKLPEILSCLPVEDIHYQNPFNSEAHILGTTRMSNDAQNGVVDKNLIHHNYRNLFVLGGSSFNTFTPANPTLTISALSLYTADKNF
ncbi:GMC family oxidoreductase [soil metagenome]